MCPTYFPIHQELFFILDRFASHVSFEEKKKCVMEIRVCHGRKNITCHDAPGLPYFHTKSCSFYTEILANTHIASFDPTAADFIKCLCGTSVPFCLCTKLWYLWISVLSSMSLFISVWQHSMATKIENLGCGHPNSLSRIWYCLHSWFFSLQFLL